MFRDDATILITEGDDPMAFLRTIVMVFLSAALMVVTGCNSSPAPGAASPLDQVRSRDTLTIAVTDSGLGGLSVVADTVEKLQSARAYRKVDLVFYNALFTAEGGYNSLPGREEKVEIFSRALQGLVERYSPDVILVACNTLSVLYADTDFAKTAKVPVIGIVEDGVNLIAERLGGDDSSRVILFGTETTVDEGTHRAALREGGIDDDRIVTQACPQLASYIEQCFDGTETEFLIDAYVGEALAVTGRDESPLYVSFNCTHYGYSLEAWETAFRNHGQEVAAFLDPNLRMIDVLIPPSVQGRYEACEVSVRAVSMVEIPAGSRDSIGRYLQDVSSETAAALAEYDLRPDLFTWRDLMAE